MALVYLLLFTMNIEHERFLIDTLIEMHKVEIQNNKVLEFVIKQKNSLPDYMGFILYVLGFVFHTLCFILHFTTFFV